MGTINERIARCIAVTGLTKTAFAKKINLSQPHISKIALGYTDPTDRTIADICREFHINETWLRTGEGEMFNKPLEALSGKLAKEYGLDELGCQIMSAYLKLNDDDRLAVGRLIQNIIDERIARSPLSAADQGAPPPWEGEATAYRRPATEEEKAWARAEAEAYYRELLLEKKAPGGSSASGGHSAEGTKGA